MHLYGNADHSLTVLEMLSCISINISALHRNIRIYFHVKWAPCHHSLLLPLAVDG